MTARRTTVARLALAAAFAGGGMACSNPVSASRTSVASVSVSPTSVLVHVGDTVTLSATPRDSAGHPLTGRELFWTSSDTTVAVVSSGGTVTGKGLGNARIVASSEARYGTAQVTVARMPVSRITISPTHVDLGVDSTAQLSASLFDARGNALTDRTVTWSSSDQGVATVSSDGLVTGTGPGDATITARSEGVSASATAHVTGPPVALVQVVPPVVQLEPRETVQLTARTYDGQGNLLTGRPITWSTADSGIATVDQTGLVTAVHNGTVAITATSGSVRGGAFIIVQH